MEEQNLEELKQLEGILPVDPTVEQLKGVIIELLKVQQVPEEEVQRFSRCHPIRCPLAWMWPMWHPTPPHVPLYPTDWA